MSADSSNPADDYEDVRTCPWCDSAEGTLWVQARDRKGEFQGVFQWLRCRECDCVWCTPRPSPRMLSDAYGRIAAERRRTHRGWGEGVLRRLRARHYRTHAARDLKRLLPWLQSERRPMRLLDMGCGRGELLAEAVRMGMEAVGIDIAPAPVGDDTCACQIHRMPVENCADHFPPASFDVVTARAVLEHLREPTQALQAAARLVRPGGVLFATVPDWRSKQATVFASTWSALDTPRHLYLYSRRTLLDQLDSAGFRALQVTRYSRRFDTPGVLLSLLPGINPSASLVSTCLFALWDVTGPVFESLRFGASLEVIARRVGSDTGT